jgi:enoyl-CoA hydratase/carnithine racemase
MDTYALLVGQLGPARTLDLLLRARYLTGADAHAAGFVAELVPADSTLEEVLAGVLGTLAGHAPLTMWATKARGRAAAQGEPAAGRRPGGAHLRQRRLCAGRPAVRLPAAPRLDRNLTRQ